MPVAAGFRPSPAVDDSASSWFQLVELLLRCGLLSSACFGTQGTSARARGRRIHQTTVGEHCIDCIDSIDHIRAKARV